MSQNQEIPTNQTNISATNIAGLNTGSGTIRNVTQNNLTTEQQKSLADAAKEIKELLEQLSADYPLTEVPAMAEAEIKQRPALRKKVVGALRAGCKAVLEELVDHPAVSILMATAEGWNSIN